MGDLVTMHHNSASLTSNGHKCLPNSILVTATACTGPGHSESGEDSCLGYGNPAHSLPTALSSLPSAQSPRHQSAACQPVTAFNPGSCQPLKASPLTQLSPWQLESSGETSLKVFPRLVAQPPDQQQCLRLATSWMLQARGNQHCYVLLMLLPSPMYKHSRLPKDKVR